MIASDEFWTRAEQAIRALDAQPELAAAVQVEVDAFYERHRGLARTRMGEAFIASLVIEKLSNPGASQAPDTATATTQKVA